MTVQIPNYIKHLNRVFCIVDCKDDFQPFKPHEYNLSLRPIVSCNWKAYELTLKINEDNILCIDELFFTNYGKINSMKWFGMLPEREEQYSKESYHYWFENMNIRYDYTGKILIADADIEGWANHGMDPALPYAFDILMELEFKDGKLINTIDLSYNAFKLRKKYNDMSDDNQYNFYHSRFPLMSGHNWSWLHNVD